MIQDKQAHIKQTDEMISLGTEISDRLTNALKGLSEFDDRIKLPEKIENEIFEKTQKTKECDITKGEIILKIIGQMYKGTLVEKKLSIRKGQVFTFGCRRSPSIYNVKKHILNNLHEVAGKLPAQNLEILEFILDKVYENNVPHIRERWYGDNLDERQKIIRIPHTKIIEINDNNRRNDSTDVYSIHEINGIVVNHRGDVHFFYEFVDEGNNTLKTGMPSISRGNYSGLFLKYEKQILENAKELIAELDNEIKNFDTEIEQIKLKGQNQLALCELQDIK